MAPLIQQHVRISDASSAVPNVTQPIYNEQLKDIDRIIVEYFDSFNYLEIIYDGELIPDGICMCEIPNILNIIRSYAFHSSPQLLPNIVAFMDLDGISFDIETLTNNTINSMKQKIITEGDGITDNISNATLIMKYATAFMANTNFWHTYIMYHSPYEITDDDSEDEDDQ
jgi:hypothetical protein